MGATSNSEENKDGYSDIYLSGVDVEQLNVNYIREMQESKNKNDQ